MTPPAATRLVLVPEPRRAGRLVRRYRLARLATVPGCVAPGSRLSPPAASS
jgi:hypothetical protein